MSYAFEIRDQERAFQARDSESFNRIEFALRVLDLIRLQMNVTVYPRGRSLQIRRGRDWKVGPDAEWVMIGVPRDASRLHIVYALAELAGVARQPFLLDWVARAASVPSTATSSLKDAGSSDPNWPCSK
jgi:hypothetical protein